MFINISPSVFRNSSKRAKVKDHANKKINVTQCSHCPQTLFEDTESTGHI